MRARRTWSRLKTRNRVRSCNLPMTLTFESTLAGKSTYDAGLLRPSTIKTDFKIGWDCEGL
jgi:hypothetical protein